jgi:hypothetical protein
MRNTVLAAAVLVLAGAAHAQELKKGNLIGTHLMTVKLEPGVAMEQFADFYNKRVVPELEKTRPGWKAYPVKRVRGEKADGMGLIIVIASEGERDKYYNADGSPTELGKASTAKLQLVNDEMKKLGTITSDLYTDWVVY